MKRLLIFIFFIPIFSYGEIYKKDTLITQIVEKLTEFNNLYEIGIKDVVYYGYNQKDNIA